MNIFNVKIKCVLLYFHSYNIREINMSENMSYFNDLCVVRQDCFKTSAKYVRLNTRVDKASASLFFLSSVFSLSIFSPFLPFFKEALCVLGDKYFKHLIFFPEPCWASSFLSSSSPFSLLFHPPAPVFLIVTLYLSSSCLFLSSSSLPCSCFWVLRSCS